MALAGGSLALVWLLRQPAQALLERVRCRALVNAAAGAAAALATYWLCLTGLVQAKHSVQHDRFGHV